MSSDAQVRANQCNAKKSTGPSEKSRARTRYNGLKHGLRADPTQLLPGESEEEFGLEHDHWIESLRPRDAAEHKLALEVVSCFWMR
jgi:hypothetical protein